MRAHDAVIVGAGPAGLMLAGELSLAGADVAVLESRPSHEELGWRAVALQPRTMEVFDQRGIAGRFLDKGDPAPVAGFGWTLLDIGDLPTRHPYTLGLCRDRAERILGGWVRERKVPVYHGRQVTGFAQDGTGVDIETTAGEPLRARFLVGCDGSRSVIRKKAGIGFGGWDAENWYLIAHAEMDAEPEMGLRRDGRGFRGILPMNEGPRLRILVPDLRTGRSRAEPAVDELREAVTAAYGTDFGLRDAVWISRYSDAALQAERYRDRRVLLAGDAAHVHIPIGGQGINLAIQDAVNLGWKLARVLAGISPDSLLDSYHAERHPVAARVLRSTLAQTALTRGDPRTQALNEVVAGLLRLDEPRAVIAGLASGLDTRYDLGGGHPLTGRRMPDLDLDTAEGPTRVFALLRDARPLLLSLGEPCRPGAVSCDEQIRVVDASCAGPWELPVIGVVPAPEAVLVRPDGHVAWAGDPADPGLGQALAQWFGPCP